MLAKVILIKIKHLIKGHWTTKFLSKLASTSQNLFKLGVTLRMTSFTSIKIVDKKNELCCLNRIVTLESLIQKHFYK